MARPIKEGLSYFPLDVDFFEDEKIEFVSAKYGALSELVLIKLLSRVYRQGYFISWCEDSCLLLARKMGGEVTEDFLQKVVDEATKREFFSLKLYKKYKILTSKGIQTRFVEAAKRRKKINLCKRYLLLDKVYVRINKVNVYINGINDDISTQSRVEESKREERRVKESKGKEKKKNKTLFVEVIDYLNTKLGTRYKAGNAKTKSFMNARVTEGFGIEDFKIVIDKKYDEWKGTEQERYLRPETLFGNKFEGYLNQKVLIKSEPKGFEGLRGFIKDRKEKDGGVYDI